MRVALFITCLADSFYPRAGIATVKLLEYFGCTVHFPQAQTCCGQPLYNNGYHDHARPLARSFIRVFEDARYVVTPSGSCAGMVREHFPRLLREDHAWLPAAEALRDKTWELAQFLTRVLKVDLRDHGAKWPGTATYHYSCHSRALGVAPPADLTPLTVAGAPAADPHQPALRLLAQIEGLTLVPLERADQCCGFGGVFATRYPAVSAALGDDKLGCITATRSPVVVSSEPGCTMHLAGLAHRRNVDLEFKTLAEIIAEALGLLPRIGPAVGGGARA